MLLIRQDLKDFLKEVKDRRERMSMTQDDMADKLSCTQTTISYAETERREPSLEFLARMGEAVGLEVRLTYKRKKSGQ